MHTDLVLRLHAEGLSLKAIAQTTGLSKGEVFNALSSAGLSKKKMNRPTELTPWEDAILLGTMLGDGHIRYRHAGQGNPHFALSHAAQQKEYLEWKVEQLSSLFFDNVCKIHEDNEGHKSVHATSRACPLLVPYFERFYSTGKKDISADTLQLVEKHEFRDAILALWFGDDGYKSSGNGRSLGFCFGALPQERYEEIAQWFAELGFQGKLHVHMGRQSYRFFLMKVEAAHRFRSAVEPYLPPSMQYKLDIGPPRKIRRSRS